MKRRLSSAILNEFAACEETKLYKPPHSPFTRWTSPASRADGRAEASCDVFQDYRCLIGQRDSQSYYNQNNIEFPFVFKTEINKYGKIQRSPDNPPADCIHHFVKKWGVGDELINNKSC